VALVKWKGVISLLCVVQFLIKLLFLEYSSIRNSSHVEFQEIRVLFDNTVSSIVAGSGSIIMNNNSNTFSEKNYIPSIKHFNLIGPSFTQMALDSDQS